MSFTKPQLSLTGAQLARGLGYHVTPNVRKAQTKQAGPSKQTRSL